jgi:hypothetical protein
MNRSVVLRTEALRERGQEENITREEARREKESYPISESFLKCLEEEKKYVHGLIFP